MERILIVDDDPQIVKLIEVCLKRESFDVETAYDGVSALQKITSQENFDLIISDLMMPEMDGNTLLSSIKQIAPDVLRHRIITSYEAEAENISSDHIVQRILDHTDVP